MTNATVLYIVYQIFILPDILWIFFIMPECSLLALTYITDIWVSVKLWRVIYSKYNIATYMTIENVRFN